MTRVVADRPSASQRIAASKRRGARFALVLAVVGAVAQVVGYRLGGDDALALSIVMYAGVVLASAAIILASATLVGVGQRVVPFVAIAVAVAPVTVLLVSVALNPTPEY